jgi:hypothetical protein
MRRCREAEQIFILSKEKRDATLSRTGRSVVLVDARPYTTPALRATPPPERRGNNSRSLTAGTPQALPD